MRVISTFLFLSLLLQSPVFAEGLGVKIFFIDNLDKLEEAIKTPYEHAPTIQLMKKAQKNQLVYAGFAVSGFQLDSENKLCLNLDVKIIDPNGKLIFTQEPFIKDERVLSQEGGHLIIDGLLEFLIENSDPSGTYKISARLIDGNKKDFALDNYKIIIEE
jgi:hypothetical protein